MGIYEELHKKKETGENLQLAVLTKADFEQIYFQEGKSIKDIADLFSVSKSKVVYRRRKLGVTLHKHTIQKYLLDKHNNEEAFQWLQCSTNLDSISKAITHFAFRNGAVEDMHADGKLTQEDMKTLNKYMVNHLGYVFQLIQAGKWLELRILIAMYNDYGHAWDAIEQIEDDVASFLALLSKK